VLIELSGPELPAGDGSALPYVELAESAGREEFTSPARIVKLCEPVWVSHQDKYVFAVPSEGLDIAGLVSFPHPMIGEQASACSVDIDTFKREIAPARTFCTSGEIDALLSAGLGLGGNDDNVIVVYDDRYNVPLRYGNEFVRHKVLDLIGDLSLAGGRVSCSVTAIKSSHTLNTALAKGIVMQLEKTDCRQGG
jgi:UDP-3-O-[3-hydroxymyristoyl] N-acetylglucosamine deacetylase